MNFPFLRLVTRVIDWQVLTHELCEKLVSNQRLKEHVAFLKTSAEFGVYLLDLIRPALQIFKNVHLKFIAAKVNVSCNNVAERPPGRPDLGAQPTSC